MFWDEFCEKEPMRNAVLAIAAHAPVEANSPEVRRLLDYGYIVSDGAEGFRMRVPLFEEWVKRFGV